MNNSFLKGRMEYCEPSLIGNMGIGSEYYKGEKGEKGDKPVRGVDYWTAEDQAAIEANMATQLNQKQDKLEAGENIKIEGNVISSIVTASEPEVVIIDYGCDYATLKAAKDSGKMIICRDEIVYEEDESPITFYYIPQTNSEYGGSFAYTNCVSNGQIYCTKFGYSFDEETQNVEWFGKEQFTLNVYQEPFVYNSYIDVEILGFSSIHVAAELEENKPTYFTLSKQEYLEDGMMLYYNTTVDNKLYSFSVHCILNESGEYVGYEWSEITETDLSSSSGSSSEFAYVPIWCDYETYKAAYDTGKRLIGYQGSNDLLICIYASEERAGFSSLRVYEDDNLLAYSYYCQIDENGNFNWSLHEYDTYFVFENVPNRYYYGGEEWSSKRVEPKDKVYIQTTNQETGVTESTEFRCENWDYDWNFDGEQAIETYVLAFTNHNVNKKFILTETLQSSDNGWSYSWGEIEDIPTSSGSSGEGAEEIWIGETEPPAGYKVWIQPSADDVIYNKEQINSMLENVVTETSLTEKGYQTASDVQAAITTALSNIGIAEESGGY